MQRLPKSLESDHSLQQQLSEQLQPLYEGSELKVPFLALSVGLQQAVAFARRCGKVKGGLESIELQLQKEATGLTKSAAKGTPNQATGASRLLFVSNDGSERFYRNVESLSKKHTPRLYVIRLEMDSGQMGAQFFGASARVKAMMVLEKDFVARCFQSLAEKV
jgi:hypothetical protein